MLDLGENCQNWRKRRFGLLVIIAMGSVWIQNKFRLSLVMLRKRIKTTILLILSYSPLSLSKIQFNNSKIRT